MQRSGGTKRNEMKLYYGYGSPTERRKRLCEDEGEEAGGKAACFQAALPPADERTVEWREERPTGTAERN
ncbi:hypothetical protein CLU82_3289 [Flavobacterium sp. 5]|nr:hypothetical protein CLU82_3289 [Flavobacterium sp. 5]